MRPLLLLTLFSWLLTGNLYAEVATNQSEKLVGDTQQLDPLSSPKKPSFALEPQTSDLPVGESSPLPSQSAEQPFNLPSATSEDSLSENNKVLPPDEAFIFSTSLEEATVLVAHWQIAADHYLYRDKFKFALIDGGVLGEPQFPPGTTKEDIKYGLIEIYEHTVAIKLPLKETQGLDHLTLKVTYQGCAEDKLCYPPIEKTTIIDLPNLTTTSIGADSKIDVSQPNQSEAKESESSLKSYFKKLSVLLGLTPPDKRFLDPEQAFIFSAVFSNPDYLTLRWQIAEGYYLYRNKLHFFLQSPGQLGTPLLPTGIFHQDKVSGKIEVYQQPVLEIQLPIKTNGSSTVTLQVEYQGCAIAGLCYAPIKKTIDLTKNRYPQIKLAKATSFKLKTVVSNPPLAEQDRIANLLAQANKFYTIMMFFGLGLLLSFTPCVFPMIPILSSIIVGQGERVTTYKAFLMSISYVLAMAITYATIGVLTGLLGENLQATFQQSWVLIAFALVFVALALSMFGCYELQMPVTLQTHFTTLSNRQAGGTLIGVAIMGVLSALIVGPCIAAPLMGALIYIGQTGDALLGGLALFSMSLGMGIPLIIVGVSAGHWLPKAGEWMEIIRSIFGVMLLAIAIWMLDRVVPPAITMLLTASLFIIAGVYMGALDNIKIGVSGWLRLWKGLGIILLVYGILLLIGLASGNNHLLQPLQHLRLNQTLASNSNEITQSSLFKSIKGLAGLTTELTAATQQGKPVMLDFYADWCVSCKEMEHFTFADPQVQQLLSHFVLLRTDVTSNDEQDKILYKYFGIYGPPAILFFDSHRQEQRAYRVIGFMPAEQFRQHLKQIQPL
ncbi:protein-disulfide reductase [Thioploca ingrica]|uniref:Thiol:disulfide interchange protein DsbD n=1 Tax=Thioploca ingrica TaxID=40754 RepID=A0A090AQX8_9GAMM|nr:protein-disulfide reductase [Thioploca ingrica]